MSTLHEMERLDGIEIARFFAFLGMVLVNFTVMIGAEGDPSVLGACIRLLEGKAAATFVVVAGLGLGLMAQRYGEQTASLIVIKRAMFLMVLGLLNVLIFPADILHFYAAYFFLSAFLLRFSNNALFGVILLLNCVFLILAICLDYEAGWDFENYEYDELWTLSGFMRNLWFNGWHPVFPWLGFVLVGLMISRLPLTQKSVQKKLVIWCCLAIIFAESIRWILEPSLTQIDEELIYLVTTSPIPPMPLYFIVGVGISGIVIGLSLLSSAWLTRLGISQILIPAGKQTLSLYIFHVVFGLLLLEWIDSDVKQTAKISITYSLIFLGASLLYSWIWMRRFKRGPLEWVMRKLTG